LSVHTPGVLEDASGRRARWMRRAGRVVFLFFLAWLVAILLGGLGLTPIPRLPLGHTLRPSPGPPKVKLPPPTPTPATDLAPALPAAAVATPGVGKIGGTRRGRSATAPGQTKTTTTPGRSSTAPGHTKTTTTRGRSTTAPGHTKTTTTTTTTHGNKKKP
jgi:hypothetical protein